MGGRAPLDPPMILNLSFEVRDPYNLFRFNRRKHDTKSLCIDVIGTFWRETRGEWSLCSIRFKGLFEKIVCKILQCVLLFSPELRQRAARRPSRLTSQPIRQPSCTPPARQPPRPLTPRSLVQGHWGLFEHRSRWSPIAYVWTWIWIFAFHHEPCSSLYCRLGPLVDVCNLKRTTFIIQVDLL